jgi:hypothetical protein
MLFIAPEDVSIQGYNTIVPGLSCFVQNGIPLTMIQNILRWFGQEVLPDSVEEVFPDSDLEGLPQRIVSRSYHEDFRDMQS